MGIGSFFKKVWSGVKHGATKVWDFGKKVVEKGGRILRPAIDIARKAAGFMSMLPGKAGKFGEMFKRGTDFAKHLTDMLPDSQAKKKIEEAIDKGSDNGQRYIQQATDKITQFNDRVQPWLRSGVQIGEKVAGMM